MPTQVRFPIIVDGLPKFWADPAEAEAFARLGSVRVYLRHAVVEDARFFSKAFAEELDEAAISREIMVVLFPTFENVYCLGDLGPPLRNALSTKYVPPPAHYTEVKYSEALSAPTVDSITTARHEAARGVGVHRRKNEAPDRF